MRSDVPGGAVAGRCVAGMRLGVCAGQLDDGVRLGFAVQGLARAGIVMAAVNDDDTFVFHAVFDLNYRDYILNPLEIHGKSIHTIMHG